MLIACGIVLALLTAVVTGLVNPLDVERYVTRVIVLAVLAAFVGSCSDTLVAGRLPLTW